MINKELNKKNVWIEKYLNTALLLWGIAAIFVLKIIGDSAFFFFGDIYSGFATSWKLLLSSILILFLILFFIKNYNDSIKDPNETGVEKYFKELSRILYLTIGIMVFNRFIPDEISGYAEI